MSKKQTPTVAELMQDVTLQHGTRCTITILVSPDRKAEMKATAERLGLTLTKYIGQLHEAAFARLEAQGKGGRKRGAA